MSSIRLVPFHTDYADSMAERLSDPEVRKYLDFPVFSKQACQSYIHNAIGLETLGFAVHRFILDSTDTLVGAISLHHIDPDAKTAQMGTWLGRPFWGLGYNQTAKGKMLQIAFEHLRLSQVFFLTPHDHHRSLRALAKLGYVEMGVNRLYPTLCKQIQFQTGTDIILSVVTREEWKKRKALLK